jgi:hypothetical protein
MHTVWQAGESPKAKSERLKPVEAKLKAHEYRELSCLARY